MVFYGFILNTKEESLEILLREKNIENIKNVYLVVDKANFKLEFYADSILIKKYKISLGRNRSKNKKEKNDQVTPTGVYEICSIIQNCPYYRSFKLNYPNEKDAAEAFKNNYISYKEYVSIVQAAQNGDCPPENTRLGSDLNIHGIGKYDFIFRNLPFVFNWTNGSVAISNKNMDELIKVINIGTKVIIKE